MTATASPLATKRWTYDDLLELPDDDKRYEILDGELFVNAAPIPRHQLIVMKIAARLFDYLESHGSGQVFGAAVDVLLADGSVLQPDVVVIKSDRASIIGPKNIEGPPHLCIEVLSDSTRRRDEIIKRKLYERGGVDEYWIVDPELELVKIYRRAEAGAPFQRVAEISTETGGAITTPLLPAFTLDVADVFRT
jgi:Uma2 family endonuclease